MTPGEEWDTICVDGDQVWEISSDEGLKPMEQEEPYLQQLRQKLANQLQGLQQAVTAAATATGGGQILLQFIVDAASGSAKRVLASSGALLAGTGTGKGALLSDRPGGDTTVIGEGSVGRCSKRHAGGSDQALPDSSTRAVATRVARDHGAGRGMLSGGSREKSSVRLPGEGDAPSTPNESYASQGHSSSGQSSDQRNSYQRGASLRPGGAYEHGRLRSGKNNLKKLICRIQQRRRWSARGQLRNYAKNGCPRDLDGKARGFGHHLGR